MQGERYRLVKGTGSHCGRRGRGVARQAAGGNPTSVCDQLAIVLDGVVISSPSINGPITDGKGQITGNFTHSSAREVVADLQSGALPASFRISAITTVTPAPPTGAAQ